MLQLHLSDQQFYCTLRCDLYKRLRYVIFKWILVIDGWGISSEIALTLMSLDFTVDQSTLVEVMVWCHQATSHYLSLKNKLHNLFTHGNASENIFCGVTANSSRGRWVQLTCHGQNQNWPCGGPNMQETGQKFSCALILSHSFHEKLASLELKTKYFFYKLKFSLSLKGTNHAHHNMSWLNGHSH